MSWIRAHYDRLALLAAALFLLLCSISIWNSAVGFGRNFAVTQTAAPHKGASPPAKALELAAAAEKLHQPPQWTFGGRSGLFVPEKHFIGTNGLPATLQTTMLHPPVPNEWLEQFGLPIADADVLDQDPDGDGFTNLDEWQGHTNPIDPKSHPDYLTKLKLKSVTQEPFRLVFSSWAGDTFHLNFIDPKAPADPDGRARIDPSQPTLMAKLGEPILQYDPAQRKMTETGFRVVDFKENYEPDQYGTNIDVSALTLENIQTGEKITLVKEKRAVSPEAVATLVYSWPAGQPAKQFEVRKDQEFSLKPQEQIKYKLVDVQPPKAVIVNMQNPKEQIEIGLLTP